MQKKKRYLMTIVICLIFLTAGCGKKETRITDGSEAPYINKEQKKEHEDTEIEEDLPEGEESLFVVAGIDTDRKIITLRDYETTREKPYNYSGGTYIKGKYGDNLTMDQVSIGELVTIERTGEDLTKIQISDKVFSYEGLYNFTLDTEKKILTVGKTTYFLDDNILAYHGNSKISLSEISEQDTICLKGVDRQIYTIQVTEGHGMVVLENIDVFQGGYITIGNLISMKITPQMRIEVGEGRYLLSVANDGYGGSREITVESNRETVVNLNELKGEGPKSCQIQFKIEPKEGKVFLDGTQIDISKAVEVRYGAHRLTAKAEGYEEWSRVLIVNSKTAEITIELTDKESGDTISTVNTNSNQNSSNTNNKSNSSQNTNTNRKKNTNNNTNTNNNNNSNTNNNNNSSNNSNNNNNNNSNNSNNNNNTNNNNSNSNNNNNNSNNTNNNNSNNTNNNSNSNTNNNNSNNNNNNTNSNTNNNNNSNNNNSNNNTNDNSNTNHNNSSTNSNGTNNNNNNSTNSNTNNNSNNSNNNSNTNHNTNNN